MHSIVNKASVDALNNIVSLYSARNEHHWREVAPSINNILKLFVGSITRCYKIAVSRLAVGHWESHEGAESR